MTEIELIKERLSIAIPHDLLYLWSDSTFYDKQRAFAYYGYGDMKFLSPLELYETTLKGNPGVASSERTKLSYLKENKTLTESQYYTFSKAIFNDTILISKEIEQDLNFEEIAINKPLVFAVTEDKYNYDNVFMFYGVNAKTNNLGVWIWNRNMGSKNPVKIGDNLTDVFGSIERLKQGFSSKEMIDKLWDYYPTEYIPESTFVYGHFPEKDLRQVAMEIDSAILFVEDNDINKVSAQIKESINDIYKLQDNNLISNLFNKENETSLESYLYSIKDDSFNCNKDKRIYLIKFPYTYFLKFGISLCTKEQAYRFNQYGLIQFNQNEDKLNFLT